MTDDYTPLSDAAVDRICGDPDHYRDAMDSLAREVRDRRKADAERNATIERLQTEIGAILGHAHGWGLHKNCPCLDTDCPFT